MPTIGRNDSCPCGSGKKYKNCHGAVHIGDLDSRYQRLRQLDGEASYHLQMYIGERFGPIAIEKACREFHFNDGSTVDPESAEFEYFDRWFLYNWKPDRKSTVPEMILREENARIGQDLRNFLKKVVESPYSYYQVLKVDPGTGIDMRDILRKIEVRVMERSASATVQAGSIMYARVVELDGINFMMGCGVYDIPAEYIEAIIDIRSGLEKKKALTSYDTATKTLLLIEEELRRTYFGIEENLKHPKITLTNTDGDPIQFYTMTYRISSFTDAFDALKIIEQRVDDSTDEELMQGPEKAIIHWYKKPKNKEAEEFTLLAILILDRTDLSIETNSEKRAKRIQNEITRRLGDKAVLLKTEIKSPEGAAAMAEQKEPESPKEINDERQLRDEPEVRDFIKMKMESHWSSWPDIPVPALRDMTPRQAAKDPIGRELLESLLLDFESKNRFEDDELLRVDTAKLRRELGMDG